jgi:hypothetical protein
VPALQIVTDTTAKIMCVPVAKMDGVTQIVDLCDASGINEKYNLKLIDDTCAKSGQKINGVRVLDQVMWYAFGTQDDVKKATLPACDMSRAVINF